MLFRQSISPLPDTDPARDQERLFAIGLEHVRELSRQLWTDHNTHDPGITTLELLCYALTDLSYRTSFPVQDLLAGPANHAEAADAELFTARTVLPNRPLTLSDYRKMLIDLPQVRNAWVSKHSLTYGVDVVNRQLRPVGPDTAETRQVDLSGLYDVRIDFADHVKTAEQRQAVIDEAMQLLQANRNLCEDFVSIAGIEIQKYALCADIALTSDADQDEVAAQIFFQVDRYLAPPVHHHSLAEMLARPHAEGRPRTADEIFDGPLLQHGFIDNDDLAASELRSEIRLSDIIHIIMDIPGVQSVGEIALSEVVADADIPAGAPRTKPSANRWRVKVPQQRQPRLAIESGRLLLHRRHIALQQNEIKMRARLTQLKQTEGPPAVPTQEDLPVPQGRNRQTGVYHSFQYHFPANYGLADTGLPSHVDARRRAQAMQLKGYLLFFDQVMANFCAQLSQLSQLLSRQATTEHTYFGQVVDFPDSDQVYQTHAVDADQLTELLETPDVAIRRRHRILDHLLARCGENLNNYTDAMRIGRGPNEQRSLSNKQAFLQYASERGDRRGLADDQTRPKWDSDNISELERRLEMLLGIRGAPRRDLTAVVLDDHTQIEETTGGEFRFRIKHPSSNKILLSSSKHYPDQEAAQQELELAINLGQQQAAYERKDSVDGKRFFNVTSPGGEVIARRIEYFTDDRALEEAITEVIVTLRQRYSNEGMYLIENILLRPEPDQDGPFLPICIAPACPDCANNDPYSYRVHIILPAYTGRFIDLDFRRFVEETIRNEIPAHILPKICWADFEQLQNLQTAYREWLEPPLEASAEQRRQILQTLVSVLSHIKNVYPKRTLQGSDPSSEPPFILDRTQLGSLD